MMKIALNSEKNRKTRERTENITWKEIVDWSHDSRFSIYKSVEQHLSD